jgi:hypothetical protein
MSGFELVTGVIAAFFIIGIGVGVLLVIALPMLRRRRRASGAVWRDYYQWWRGLPADDGSGGIDWEDLAGPGDEDEQRRWPCG